MQRLYQQSSKPSKSKVKRPFCSKKSSSLKVP
jgi:hypothetical protein